jgi:tripartite-type tricarboxylate transporter receptor subunit TctC
MKPKMSRIFLCAGIGVVLFLSAALAMAAEFPSRPVTLIVPWPPGGSTDATMRILAETTSKYLGQPVVIENKGGGSGSVGPATMAAAAKPDGYTVSQIPISVFRFPYMMKTTWDAQKDFTYIIHLTGYTFGVVVRSDSPWKTWNEFMDYAKANPGKITVATPGAGGTPHITMDMLALKNGIKWVLVPMKGGAETVPSLLGGHVTAVADSAEWGPHVDAGTLRLLVTWGNIRTKKWPNVPTLKELGYGVVSNSPFGIAGPKGMDPKVVKVLHDAFKKGMDDPAYRKILDTWDMEPFYMSTEDYTKYVKIACEEEKEKVEKLGLKKQ